MNATQTQTDTIETLTAAFDMVCSADDWKAPIDAIVDVDDDLNLIRRAVIHFTATDVQWKFAPEHGPTKLRVTAKGYRMGPAGDH